METLQTIAYGYVVHMPLAFSEAVARVKAAFLAEGFGVLSEIDVQAKMKEKLGKAMSEYLILGMCHPTLAYEALQIETNIGLLLPCNVVVRTVEDGVIVAAQRPDIMLGVTGNALVTTAAQAADEKIRRALGQLIV